MSKNTIPLDLPPFLTFIPFKDEDELEDFSDFDSGNGYGGAEQLTHKSDTHIGIITSTDWFEEINKVVTSFRNGEERLYHP